MKKRLVSFLLALCLLVGCLPMGAGAVSFYFEEFPAISRSNPYYYPGVKWDIELLIWQIMEDRVGISFPYWGEMKDWCANAKKSGYRTVSPNATYAPENSLALFQDGDSYMAVFLNFGAADDDRDGYVYWAAQPDGGVCGGGWGCAFPGDNIPERWYHVYYDLYDEEDEFGYAFSELTVSGLKEDFREVSGGDWNLLGFIVFPYAMYGTPFTDVNDYWGKEAVPWVYENELFSGTSKTTFSPYQTMTRAMLAAVLHRLAGTPASAAPHPFRDVKSGAYYEDAVAWAAESGVVSGTGEETFSPNASITREQLATMLYRYARLEGIDTESTADLSQYEDESEISDWAKEAMGWALHYGIVRGKTETKIAPAGKATRGEVAIMLKRYATSRMLRPEKE